MTIHTPYDTIAYNLETDEAYFIGEQYLFAYYNDRVYYYIEIDGTKYRVYRQLVDDYWRYVAKY